MTATSDRPHVGTADGCPVAHGDLETLARDFDAYDQATAQHVFEVTAIARDTCPVVHSAAHGGYYLVTGHDAAREVMLDPETYSSSKGVAFPHHQTIMMPPIDLDPPLQTEFRRLLNTYLSRVKIAPYAGAIREMAIASIEPWLESGTCDLVRDFSAPFTAAVLSRVILHVDDEATFERARTVVQGIARQDQESDTNFRAQLKDVVSEILAARAESGLRQEDILDALLHGTVDGRALTDDERSGTLMILVMGGLSTTSGSLANMFCHVATDPSLETRLREPGWERSDFDEFLRYESPVGNLSRSVMKDTVLAGQELKAGDTVVVHFAAANRDDTAFSTPDELDFERDRNPHLAFGLGAHRCIGSNMARLQVAIGVEELLKRITNVRLVTGVVLEREAGSGLSWTSLPITFDRR